MLLQSSTPAQAELEELDSRYVEGDFDGLANDVARWQERWSADASAPRQRAHLLRLRCLAKSEDWPALITGCADALHEASATAEGAPVEVLVTLSYAELQTGKPLMALRAALAARELCRHPDAVDLTAQALDRVAMSYLWLGDPVRAESQMLESIGYCLQLGDDDVSLLRYSNGLFLFHTLLHALQQAGRKNEAEALIRRTQRFVTQAQKIEHRSSKRYERCMWQTNLASWDYRRGHEREAQDALEQRLAEATAHHWSNIRRAAALLLAEIAESQERWSEARAYLLSMQEPIARPPRRRQALLMQQALVRVQRRLGCEAAALQAQRHVEQLQQPPPPSCTQTEQQLMQAIARLLSPESLQRLERELHRAEADLAQGQPLSIPGG